MVRGATQLTGARLSASQRAVLDVVDAIPEGQVLSYGDVAALAGLASARQVGLVLAHHGHEVPWHRVVMADGSLAAHLESEQRARLRGEEVRFIGARVGAGGAGKVDMDRARWRGTPGATATPLSFVGPSQVSKGVRQRRFDLDRDGRTIPGLLWTPVGGRGSRPLVLLGHGAGNTKSEPYIMAMARRFVRHHQFAALCIDGPVHGDRRADGGVNGGLMFLEFGQRWAHDPDLTDAMAADWRATLDAVQVLPEVSEGPVAWWGLSMGTIFGLPVVASDERVQAAVLGCMGLGGPTDAVRQRVLADAQAITCPVLFLLQWDDEIFTRRSSLDLFDALGSTDKRLHAHPGSHTAVPIEEMDASEAFLAARLTQAR